MKFRNLVLITAFMATVTQTGNSQTVDRVEPLSWWIGMETPLQLMLHGPDISKYEFEIIEPGVEITKIHLAESPNYIFADISIDPNASPGDYTIRIRNGKKKKDIKYTIAQRREGSKERKSFTSADLMYLIMPDRFANGDTSNDSTSDTAEKVSRDSLSGRHGGDIQGIIDHLDYMQDLGVTTLWSTPLLLDNEPRYSYHGYACADYYKVDPRYGSNELFRQMVSEAHAKGIKVIKDVVTNHCGTAHWWMQDLPFRNWINQHDSFTRSSHNFMANGDPNGSRREIDLCTNGWFDTSMPDMCTQNPYVLQYFIQAFVWWIEWADLDGLRVDTFPYNEKHSIADWTAAILKEYPNLNIVGECWKTEVPFVAYWDGGANNRDGYNSNLPSVMDFPLQDAIVKAIPRDTIRRGGGMMNIYNTLAQDLLYEDSRRLLIFLDNHDIHRFADVMKGDPEKIKMGITLLATMRGVPQLYYGTEVMLMANGGTRTGHGGARVDFPGGWPGDEINLFEGAKTGEMPSPQKEVFEYTRKLFNWRKGEPVIHFGKTMHFQPVRNTYSFYRYDSESAVFVFVNGSKDSQTIEWNRYEEIASLYSRTGTDVLTGESVTAHQDTPLEIAPNSSIIIKFGK